MVTQYGEGCLKSFIMNSFLKIHHLNGTSSIFVGLSSFSVARKPLFVTSPLLSCVGSLWHCPLLFPSKTSPLWFGQPLDFFRSARTSCSTSGGPACPPVPSGYPNPTRYPVFCPIPDPTRPDIEKPYPLGTGCGMFFAVIIFYCPPRNPA